MSIEIISGLIGGWFAPIIGKFLGKFRLWKVFTFTLFVAYLAIFLMGVYVAGFRQTVSRFHELLEPPIILIFCVFAAIMTFVAAVGRTVKRNVESRSQSETEKK